VERLTGYDATILWSRYLRGNKSALELLIKYNMQDVISLKPILETAYEKLSQSMVPPSLKAIRKIPIRAIDAVNSRPDTWANRFVIRSKRREKSQVVPELLKRATNNGHPPKIVGVDLTGSANRASGWALLTGDRIETKLLRTDKEIIDETLAAHPDIVSIDSPLSLPVGYPNHTAIYRECERALKKVGISVFWCLLPSMRGLTMRGMLLAKKLRHQGMQVIESYPGAAQDVLLIPRKKASLEELKWGLIRAGFKGDWINEKISHDELDAITSALVGLFYLADDYIALGNAEEDFLIIPRTNHFDNETLVNRLGCVATPSLISSMKLHSVAKANGIVPSARLS
jgi:predicted nuclease with RNAse H fold